MTDILTTRIDIDLDGPLIDIIESLTDHLNSIPETSRASAYIDVSTETTYDTTEATTVATTVLRWSRPMTPEEQAEHDAKMAAAREAVKIRDLEYIARLQAQYPEEFK